MHKTFKSKFTFIELLIVVAILIALFSMLQPALQRTVWGAKHTQCMNNLKQTFQAFSLYYDDHAMFTPWSVSNGTFDGPHESGRNTRNGNPGNPAKVLVNDEYLVSPEHLFCPLQALNADEHYHADARRHNRIGNGSFFWSSYPYLYKSVRKGVIMGDTQTVVWKSFESSYNITYSKPFKDHYNLLYQDGSVIFLTEYEDEYLNFFPDAMVGK